MLNFHFDIPTTRRVWPDVMVDTETMGTRPNAPLISVGAVAFDMNTLELGPRMYWRIDLQSSVESGAVIDADTLKWWLTQADDARREVAKGGDHVAIFLGQFADFLHNQCAPKKQVRIWACGIDFDCVILAEHYRRQMRELPWEYWNQRDERTIRALYPNVERVKSGTHHNALDDAISQVEHLFKIRRTLRGQG